MGIKADFAEAEQIICRLSKADHRRLRRICQDIQVAETNLLNHAAPAMERCIRSCEGLCCRNIQLEAIIGVWDLVYILTVASECRDEMAACLEKEKPFFAADCIFLENGIGPCLLPSAARAEVCLTTFCSPTDAIAGEIRQVKRKFYQLGWFIALRKPRMAFDTLWRRLKLTHQARP
ncbi:MAG: hypothetical protein PVJ53_15245 [Desulfobacterales bacterium]|jgi:hypothetical protein